MGSWWQHKTLASILLLGISILGSLESQITESSDASAWLGVQYTAHGPEKWSGVFYIITAPEVKSTVVIQGNKARLMLLYGKQLPCSRNSLQELTHHRLHPPPSCRNKQLQSRIIEDMSWCKALLILSLDRCKIGVEDWGWVALGTTVQRYWWSREEISSTLSGLNHPSWFTPLYAEALYF